MTTLSIALAYLVIGALVELYRSNKESDEYEFAGMCMWPMTALAYLMFFVGYICGVITRWWRYRV